MKRPFLRYAALPLLTVALASSCARETVESKTDRDNVVEFTPVIGKATTGVANRAAEFTGAGWQNGDKIDIEAYKDEDNSLWYSFDLTNAGSNTWGYGIAVPVPTFAVNYYSVYAGIAGAESPTPPTITMNAGTGTATFPYTVKAEAQQEDLLAAVVENPASQGSVELQFHHILSQVNFAIQGLEGTVIEVENIRLNGIANSSTFTFGAAGGNNGTWATPTGTANYTYGYRGAETSFATNGGTGLTYLGNEGSSGTNTYNNALMLMPQTFAEGVAELVFDYTLSVGGNPVHSDTGFSIDLYNGGEKNAWEKGLRYLYILEFDGGNNVSFNVTVNSWTDAGSNTPVNPNE